MPLNFRPESHAVLSAFRDENGRKYGYMILLSRIRIYAVMVESLAMPFVTKMENRSSIRKQGIYSTVLLRISFVKVL